MIVSPIVTFYPGNDQFVELDGLIDETQATVTFINAASITGVLYDPAGIVVPNADSISFTYVASSNGNYRGLVSNTFNAPPGRGYLLKLDGVVGPAKFHVELQAEVQKRDK